MPAPQDAPLYQLLRHPGIQLAIGGVILAVGIAVMKLWRARPAG